MFDAKLDGITVRAHGTTLLDGVSLAVPRGSRYGFLGGNGAGKSTALRVLLGLIRPDAGCVTLLDASRDARRLGSLRESRPFRAALADVGTMIESASLYDALTVRENLAVWAAARGLDDARRRIDAVLAEVGLAHARDRRASRCSLGMKQRLGLAIALLGEPRLLVLDEPTNGLDPTGIVEIRECLLRRNRERGTTLVVASHVLGEIEKIATHVAILRDGRVVHEAPYVRGTDLEALYLDLAKAAA